MRICRAVRQHKFDPQRFFASSRTFFRRESFSESEILRLSYREINFDRIDSRHRSHRSGGRGDQRTYLELSLPRNSIDWRHQPGEVEVDLRRFDGGLRSLDLSFGGFYARNSGEIVLNRVVEVLLGRSLLLRQRSVALDVKVSAALHCFCIGKLSVGLRQLTFRLVYRRLKRPWIDLKKQLPLLDECTLLVALLEQVTSNLRPYIGID